MGYNSISETRTENLGYYITEPYDRPNRQEILEVEPEGRVDAVEKDMKELRYMKAAGSDVPWDVLKLSGEMG